MRKSNNTSNSTLAKKQSLNPRAPDLSYVIADLEEKLQGLERQLEAASEEQDVAAVARLGEEHNAIRLELEQKWTDWTE